jgi:uracil-DNA glycosylase
VTETEVGSGLGTLARGWPEALAPVADDLARMGDFLRAERAEGRTFFPPGPLILNAFALTPLDDVRVVILGQDPYHGRRQAMGLSFSVPPGVGLPPSLRNIFRELVDDLGVPMPTTGDLTPWARQGVLLLNATLTVGAGKAGSHRGKGWETITRRAVEAVAALPEPVVWILWGRDAQRAVEDVDPRHPRIASPHPSPYSADAGFFGSRPFSRANALLEQHGRPAVDWRLP